MLRVFEKMGVALEKHSADESWDLRMRSDEIGARDSGFGSGTSMRISALLY